MKTIFVYCTELINILSIPTRMYSFVTGVLSIVTSNVIFGPKISVLRALYASLRDNSGDW